MRGRKHPYIEIVFGATLVLCTPRAQAQVHLTPVLHHIVSVGAYEEAVPEAELFMPKAVVTDADGRIYVADTGDFTVKVFDRQGEFIRAIGREGSGPGEFLDIESLSVDQRGNLLVADVRNRRITRFSPDGEVLETMRVSSQTGALAKQITPLEDGDFLTLVSSRIREGNTPLFHRFRGDFSQESTSFGKIGNHGDAGEPFWLSSHSARPGSFGMESGRGLIYAPYLYTGKLFRYEQHEQIWRLVKILEGVTERKEAFKRVEPEFFTSGTRPDNIIGSTNYSQSGVFSAIIYNQSQQISVLRDGRIVHFSLQLTDDVYRLFLEVFNPDGELVGYGPISRLEGAEEVDLHRHCRVVWKDDQDQFYLLERSDNPKIHVVSLSY